MVAYSFKQRFAAQIADGSKAQTVRAPRRRHARPGEMIQLYAGMRSSNCVRIAPDALCASVEPITIVFNSEGMIVGIWIDGAMVEDMDRFALADGFESLAAMSEFWATSHGLSREFRGVLVRWVPVGRVQQ